MDVIKDQLEGIHMDSIDRDERIREQSDDMCQLLKEMSQFASEEMSAQHDAPEETLLEFGKRAERIINLIDRGGLSHGCHQNVTIHGPLEVR